MVMRMMVIISDNYEKTENVTNGKGSEERKMKEEEGRRKNVDEGKMMKDKEKKMKEGEEKRKEKNWLEKNYLVLMK
jgi:hypothetical protein